MSKSDANANQIVSALRAVGAKVNFIEFAYGLSGCPDILVAHAGKTVLMEIKVKGGRLSEAQKKFHAEWNGGPLVVVRTVDEALAAIGLVAVAN